MYTLIFIGYLGVHAASGIVVTATFETFEQCERAATRLQQTVRSTLLADCLPSKVAR
jgi:hypothetical protein